MKEQQHLCKQLEEHQCVCVCVTVSGTGGRSRGHTHTHTDHVRAPAETHLQLLERHTLMEVSGSLYSLELL